MNGSSDTSPESLSGLSPSTRPASWNGVTIRELLIAGQLYGNLAQINVATMNDYIDEITGGELIDVLLLHYEAILRDLPRGILSV